MWVSTQNVLSMILFIYPLPSKISWSKWSRRHSPQPLLTFMLTAPIVNWIISWYARCCMIFGWFIIFRLLKSILFFCKLNFIVPFPFLLKYYHIFFINIVFRFGSFKLDSCLFYTVFPPQGISHGMWLLAWGRVDDFSFLIVQAHFVFLC